MMTDKKTEDDIAAEEAAMGGAKQTGEDEAGAGAPEAEEAAAPEGMSAADLLSEEGAVGYAGPLDPLEAEVAALTAERDELKDKLMRALAETENTRRRAERDRKDAEAFGGTKLARDLLSVHDNMERALGAAGAAASEDTPEDADAAVRETPAGEAGENEAGGDPIAAFTSLIEGVQLTRRELLSAFAKHKIEPVKPEIGEKFDPNLHQAMFEAPIPDAPNGTVMEVMQTGFTISGRLLRPALVGVVKTAG